MLNSINRKLALLLITIICVRSFANSCSDNISKNTWFSRTVSSYSFKDIILEKPFFQIDRQDQEYFGFISGAIEYLQNVHDKNNKLGAMPFWSGTNTMTFGTNDGKSDIDVYQLGLGNIQTKNGETIFGQISLDPEISKTDAQFMLFFCNKKYGSSFFLKFVVPIGVICIKPNLEETDFVNLDSSLAFFETTANPGSSDIIYYWTKYPTLSNRPLNVSNYFFGGTKNENYFDGNILSPLRLRKGRIAPFSQEVVSIGDFSFSVGYKYETVDWLCAFAVKVACPIARGPTADYMLEPIFGRGGLWGLGGELFGHYTCWKNIDESSYVDVWIQGEALHLKGGRYPKYRSFDLLQNGPGSKYLMVQYYPEVYATISGLNITSATRAPSSVQPVINLTTLPVISAFSVEGSLATMLDFYYHNWNLGVGAEFWGRSRESLSIDTRGAVDLRLSSLNDYAVLGRQISGYQIDGQANLLQTYYCEPLARINKSQDPVQLVGTVPGVTPPVNLPEGIKDARLSENRIPGDLTKALNIAGAEMLAIYSGKLFGQIGYRFTDYHCCPYVSIFAGIEFFDKSLIQMWSLGIDGSFIF